MKHCISGIMFLAMAVPALAQEAPGRDTAERLDKQHEQAERRASDLRKSSAEVRAEIAGLQRQLIALGAKRDAHQQALNDTEARLETLSFQEKAILGKLDGERAALMDLLAALERSGMNHPPALAVSPNDVTEAARAALLLSGAAPELKARADKLSQTLAKLDKVRTGINEEKARLRTQGETLKASTQALQTLLGQRQKLERALRKDAREADRQAKALAAQASNLRELINQLETAASRYSPRKKPARISPQTPAERLHPRHKPRPDSLLPEDPFIAPTARFADSRGLLRLPVKGKIAYAFGKAKDKPRRAGLVIRARRGAQVTVPFDGRILYSGLFRNLGRLLILSVGNGYHIIIAGLERSYVVSDQLVLAGEPVGELADRSRPPPELYLEFQKGGRPIDPTPWLEKNAGGGHSVP
ncbi:MAG: peptidoglycan DD-metalloendopeptidase family protein [Robiginitomaculum sp.]|nr:peptidoglycan DD-metalloendopeptidase family protein [Robiginitomaculum sp.]MDQ7078116.1 peptidoglycan DD-metalloendopeptidase family protein [Robiginitomaculum sp.]